MNEAKTLILDANGSTPELEHGSVFFIGTATTIIRFAGFTILTDPNFLHKGQKARLGYGLRSARRTDPAIEIEDLPPLDLVVLSHMHDDHFDQVAYDKLDKNMPIVSTDHAVMALKSGGFHSTYALDTWETFTVRKGEVVLKVTSMPGKHGPGPVNFALPSVMGSMLDFETAGGARLLRLYITGDTLIHDALHEIPLRFPDIDLALLHLGGTKVLGILVTMDDKQGVQMLQITRPRTAIPIHYNDYTVFKSPLRDFARAVQAAGLSKKVKYLRHGGTYRFNVPSAGESPSSRAEEQHGPGSTVAGRWNVQAGEQPGAGPG